MLELRDIKVVFGEKTVLKNCSLSVPPGARVALMGPSGCGKTTLLRVALGLQSPDSGTVENRFSRPAAVFQEPRLLPWRSAWENVNLVLSDGLETEPEARVWLDKVELGDSAELFPAELSGGMQQRLSLARALSFRPDLLALDEPFKGLDEALRRRMLALIERSSADCAILLATHSEEDAKDLGCRIMRYDAQGFFAE